MMILFFVNIYLEKHNIQTTKTKQITKPRYQTKTLLLASFCVLNFVLCVLFGICVLGFGYFKTNFFVLNVRPSLCSLQHRLVY